jgi:hypothetical protein
MRNTRIHQPRPLYETHVAELSHRNQALNSRPHELSLNNPRYQKKYLKYKQKYLLLKQKNFI